MLLLIYRSCVYIVLYFLQVLVKRPRFQFLYCSRLIRLTMSARLWSLLQPGSWLSRYLRMLVLHVSCCLVYIFFFLGMCDVSVHGMQNCELCNHMCRFYSYLLCVGKVVVMQWRIWITWLPNIGVWCKMTCPLYALLCTSYRWAYVYGIPAL